MVVAEPECDHRLPKPKRWMVRQFRLGPAASLWIALLAAAGTAAPAKSVSAETDALTLDDAWFASVARAESLLCAASARGVVDSTECAVVAEQILVGVHVLGAVVQASIAADTALAKPLATARSHEPSGRRWPRGILKSTGMISAVASLGHIVAALSGASPQTRSVLAYVGGSAAGVSGVFDRWLARPTPRPTDAIERTHLLDLEMDLHDSVHDTEVAAELLWVELRSMALDSCATSAQVVRLARRYANALQESSVIVDSRVVRSLGLAQSCKECPGLAAESRVRCETLASQLDAVVALWREWHWLIERSKRNALDYLVLADRP